MQFCTLHLSLQVGLSTPNTFSTSTQQRNGYRIIAKKPISGVLGPLVTPSYLSTGSSPFTEAGIHPCFPPHPEQFPPLGIEMNMQGGKIAAR